MLGGFETLIDQLIAQVLSIPLINPLSYLYVILNLVLLVLATLAGDMSQFFS